MNGCLEGRLHSPAEIPSWQPDYIFRVRVDDLYK